MKYKKNFLSRKRIKVFEIKKNNRKVKDFKNENKKIFNIIKDKKKTLNDIVGNSYSHYNNLLKKNNKYSLSEISKLVLEYIKNKQITTVNEVVQYINNKLNIKKCTELIKRNIKKNIIIAIKVMCYKRIRKINKKLVYINYSSNNPEIIEKKEISNKLKNIKEDYKDVDKNIRKIKKKLNVLEKLQKNLIEKFILIKFQEQIKNDILNNISKEFIINTNLKF